MKNAPSRSIIMNSGFWRCRIIFPNLLMPIQSIPWYMLWSDVQVLPDSEMESNSGLSGSPTEFKQDQILKWQGLDNLKCSRRICGCWGLVSFPTYN